MTLDKFFNELKTKPMECQIVTLKLKYDYEEEYRYTNEILEVEDGCEYVWLNDWNEGETDVEVIAYIPVSDVKIKNPYKAKWIKPKGMMPPEHHGHYECSNCGFFAMRSWLKPWNGVVLTNYCPGCGFPMEGEREW